jgi:hypothetical protein
MSSPIMARSPAVGSWMGLLAALTLGGGAGVVRAEVRAEAVPASEQLRLVIQSYDAPAGSRAVPKNAQPVGSMQRAVTAEELRRGIVLDVPCPAMAGSDEGRDPPLVVAWVERGQPDLAFDARKARPGRGSVVGYARGGEVRIELTARSDSARSTKAG